MPNEDLIEFRREVGKVVEDSGRMLKRKPALTQEDLDFLRETLTKCAESIQIVLDVLQDREVDQF